MAEEPNGSTPKVSFTVKEMFEEVDKKLEYIIGQLTAKASKVDVDNLAERLEALEGDVGSFKQMAKIGGAVLGVLLTVGIAVMQRGGV